MIREDTLDQSVAARPAAPPRLRLSPALSRGYANHALFLVDGRIVDEMPEPTAERVLDRMKRFGE